MSIIIPDRRTFSAGLRLYDQNDHPGDAIRTDEMERKLMKMINLKKIGTQSAALALYAFCAASSQLWSQAPEPPAQQQQGDAPAPLRGHANTEQMQEHQIEHLTRQLSLTPDQVTQIRAIYKDGNTQMMSTREDSALSREDKRDRMKALHESSRSRVRATLTENQKPKFDEMIARQQEHREDHEGKPGTPLQPPPPPQQ